MGNDDQIADLQHLCKMVCCVGGLPRPTILGAGWRGLISALWRAILQNIGTSLVYSFCSCASGCLLFTPGGFYISRTTFKKPTMHRSMAQNLSNGISCLCSPPPAVHLLQSIWKRATCSLQEIAETIEKPPGTIENHLAASGCKRRQSQVSYNSAAIIVA